MSVDVLTPDTFRELPEVLAALRSPRSPRSVMNYLCGCDTAAPEVRERLSTDDGVGPLLSLWFASGRALDALCQPFAAVVRALKAEPPSLIGEEWDSVEGTAAKVLLADQLSRSCFRGSAEAFSYDPIGRALVRELVSPERVQETLTLPGAILYLLPWALAHSEEVTDLQRACEFIDLAIVAYPDLTLLERRNKVAIDQHRQVLMRFGRYPQRNAELGRESTEAERVWLDDKENLPIWAGGRRSFNQAIQ